MNLVIRRSMRRRTTMLRVTREQVLLVAPEGVPEAELLQWVHSKREWIERTARELAVRTAPTYALCDGEQLPLLGEALTLQRAGVRRPRRVGNVLEVPDLPPERLYPLVRGYYRAEALALFTPLSQEFAGRLGCAPRAVKLTEARTRWGSCTASGELRFNWRVLLGPPQVARYLCAHEVAHLRELNHSARFWRLVGTLMPEYREVRALLRDEGWRYAFELSGPQQAPEETSPRYNLGLQTA